MQQTIQNCWKKNSGLTTYINDNEIIFTEEFLDNKQIIDLVTQSAKFYSSSSEKELALISHKEKLNSLTTFINYFEQQANAEFKS
ncbi:hypothetical protein C2G38_2199651 [Gigaspora rosea]|uniref:Uncharacterized protein n=1 Tax=Gigaspora rosea TaxID=44941 RepID=A0A397URJ1_9GLOM|nr:hypothetical protein C2G38_2199651 [Gigaspora rosea]